MTLIFSGHLFAYETERLFRNFFPPMKIKLSHDRSDAEKDKDFCITEYRGGTLSVELNAKGKHIYREETVSDDTEAAEKERVLSVLLYRVLSEYTGNAPTWGILTGVRPVKVLSAVSEEYACMKLLVQKDKYLLAREISEVQKPVIGSIPPRSYSLYISIPFCPTRCSYCSFVSHSVDKAAARLDEYIEKLTRELEVTAETAKKVGLKPDTIYIGGGTPTVLSVEQLKRLMSALDYFDLSTVREFTVEAGRPDTITAEKLAVIKAAGAERISVNPQTMNDAVLEKAGRRHTAAQTVRAYHTAREAGFRVINMDLIAGLPGDNPESFKASMEEVCALSPENITVHSLSLKRASDMFRDKAGYSPQASEMVDYAHSAAHKRGYLPYYLYRQKNTSGNRENTGYAKPGTESLYNIYIMEERQTILAAGAGASGKLVDTDSGRILRIANYKYPYEYLDKFNDILAKKRAIFDFYV